MNSSTSVIIVASMAVAGIVALAWSIALLGKIWSACSDIRLAREALERIAPPTPKAPIYPATRDQ